MSIEYQNGEYCKSVKCGIPICLEDPEIREEWKTFGVVKHKCLSCEAYKFHNYLIENGYKIVKNEG